MSKRAEYLRLAIDTIAKVKDLPWEARVLIIETQFQDDIERAAERKGISSSEYRAELAREIQKWATEEIDIP